MKLVTKHSPEDLPLLTENGTGKDPRELNTDAVLKGKKFANVRKSVEPVLFMASFCLSAFSQVGQGYVLYRMRADYFGSFGPGSENASWSISNDQKVSVGQGATLHNASGLNSLGNSHIKTESTNDAVSKEDGAILEAVLADISAQAALFTTNMALLKGIPPCFLAFIYCSSTESLGRKFGIMLPLIGGVIRSMTYLSVELFKLKLEWLFVGEFIYGLSGDFTTLRGSCQAMLTESLSKESIVFRFILANSIIFISNGISSSVIGVVISDLGYAYAALILLISCALALIYTIFILSESLAKENRKSLCLKQIIYHCLSSFRILWRSRKKEGDRTSLILLYIGYAFVTICSLGIVDLEIIYVQGPPFLLNPTQVGTLLTCCAISLTVIPPVLNKVLRIFISDSLILVFVTVGYSGLLCIQGFCKTALQVSIGNYMPTNSEAARLD